MAIKKLIEVALPLEKINAESAREKSIRHGHPSTLHLWWARRPLATTRAVIWASIVDDPSSHKDIFPTEESQNKERQRLFRILEDLVIWENSNNVEVLNKAKKEIEKYSGGNPPTLLDPFAGGGAIPLEAQRLGLESHAHDLNPVAVMINKAMIEIPPIFANQAPINPDSRGLTNECWNGPHGLSEDVRYYGEWMKEEAFKRIGHLYPKVKASQDDKESTVIAWIWARTVKCPNPACKCTAPLIRSFELSSRNGKETYIQPIIDGKNIRYSIRYGKTSAEGTVKRTGAQCIFCNQPIGFDYIRQEAKNGRMHEELVGIIGEGEREHLYFAPTPDQILAAKVSEPDNCPDTDLPEKALGFRVQAYGFKKHKDLFSKRQLTVLTTLCELIHKVQEVVEKNALSAGLPNDHISLSNGGKGAFAYSQAVCVYLSFCIDKLADYNSSFCSWQITRDGIRCTFGRQAIPMVWDYAEANPFSNSSGCWNNMLEWIVKSISMLPVNAKQGYAIQHDAQKDCGLRDILVSTDPPYYDNIGYADLSDYFYVWMRQSLKDTYPELFRTMLVPKTEELIATPFRHEGSTVLAKEFFEDGMITACRQLYQYSRDDIPISIYYAYKQSDSDDISEGTASSGWETMLSAIIQSGFSITGTWPMRTEMAVRQVATGTNALASSIVLVCRKRPLNSPMCTRRDLINELKRELIPALQRLQRSNIAPVDLAQSAIGPGMGIFSKYSQVLEADGTPMTIRSALKVINQELDLYFNQQDGDLDSESRFCVDLYSQVAFNDVKFGDANTLATAKNTSIASMSSHGLLYAQKGMVHLIDRSDLPERIDAREENVWKICQQLTCKMEKEGVEGCAKAIYEIFGSNIEKAKDLAYRLYTIAERKGWAQEAYAYNTLVVAWPDIQSRAAVIMSNTAKQTDFFGIVNQ